nr:uncharacterized protein LOC129273196 [Lytechinus pictus]
MGCTVTMDRKPASQAEIRSFKRQISLSDLERFLRTKINRGLISNSDLQTKRQIETASNAPRPSDHLQVYGRICTTRGADAPPVNLSDVPGRKTVFLFGPDTVHGALVEHIHDPYAMLLKLGFLPEYIHMKLFKQKACYWLVILTPTQESFKSTSSSHGNLISIPTVPATWEGLLSFIHACYPEALPAVQAHWDIITTKPVEYFEEKSDVRFIDAIADHQAPDFMSYQKFKELPQPQKDWETRLFLYCEIRILELFSGDGHTWTEAGAKGEKEYLAPNYHFETDLGPENYIVIPLKVDIPQDIKDKYDDR